MDGLINFLLKNYLYFVFIAILLILALIGYLVDSFKTEKLKKEFASKNDEVLDIPLATLNPNVTINETVNKTAMNSNASVNVTEPALSPVELQNKENNK